MRLRALSLNPVGKQARGQAGCLDDLLRADVLHLGFSGIGRLRIASVHRWMGDRTRDALTVTKDGHPVLCALALEFENVRFVVADVVKELVPKRPLVVETPAPQGFQADLPSEGNLLFGHHGVVHLLLQD